MEVTGFISIIGWARRLKKMATVLKETTPPKQVTVDVEIIYSGNDMRPKKFIVNYSIDGELGFEVIEN